YFTERGDAVAKASKETHVMDYRALVHDKDEGAFVELRLALIEVRNIYIDNSAAIGSHCCQSNLMMRRCGEGERARTGVHLRRAFSNMDTRCGEEPPAPMRDPRRQ
ncbi:hypothetical protein AB205_0066820, partial [Aquarana catesbeiana]